MQLICKMLHQRVSKTCMVQMHGLNKTKKLVLATEKQKLLAHKPDQKWRWEGTIVESAQDPLENECYENSDGFNSFT